MKKYYQIQNKSFDELGVGSVKELWEKVKKTHDGISADSFVKFEAREKGFHADFSSAKEDRHGDVVHQNFDLKSFKKNPVVLDSHNYNSIENIIGRVTKITTKNGNLEGDVEFMLDNPKGALAHKMVEDGFLNAVSIGFIPLEFNAKGEITKSELLELSVVGVPAQAGALFKKYEEYEKHKEEKHFSNDCKSGEVDDSSGDNENNVGDYEEGGEIEEKSPEQPESGQGDTKQPKEDENFTEGQTERLECELEEEVEAEVEQKISKNDLLKLIAKELQKMRKDNIEEKRRKIYKQIRDGLSKN